MAENKIGFHARSLDELERVVEIEGVDLVELKPDKFDKEDKLYWFEAGEDFLINEKVAKYISSLCRNNDVSIQVHIPPENECAGVVERGFCQADYKHHNMLLERFKMFGVLYGKFGIGEVFTMHPPAFRFGEHEIFSEERAMKTGREFYARLDALLRHENFGFKVGIENMVAPKNLGGCVGYTHEQIDKLIGRTSEIGVTIDSGHRRLNDGISIAKLLGYGNIVNAHFHTNAGKIDNRSYDDDDEHILATEENFPHYWRYVTGFRRRKNPIVLEIGNMSSLSNEALSMYVMDLRKKLDQREA